MAADAEETPDIGEHAITVPRTARYFTLGAIHGFPRELWLVCHGYGQLAGRFLRQFAPLADGTRLIVAPEALNRFYLDSIPERRNQSEPRVGATWMTREDRLAEIADQVTYLDRVLTKVKQHLAGAAPRVVVFGFSQGTATVCRWLAASDVRADQLVLWAGLIPPELDIAAWVERLGNVPVTIVAGDADEFATTIIIAAETERLSAAGAAFSLRRFTGGHVIDQDALVALAASFTAR